MLHFFQSEVWLESFLCVKTISGWISLWFFKSNEHEALTCQSDSHKIHLIPSTDCYSWLVKYITKVIVCATSVPRSAQTHDTELPESPFLPGWGLVSWERNLWRIGNTKLRVGVSQLTYLPYHVASSGSSVYSSTQLQPTHCKFIDSMWSILDRHGISC